MVDLSELDVKKCTMLAQQIAKARLGAAEPLPPTSEKYKCTRGNRQRQKQLGDAEISRLVARYRAGATVYELANQFGCHRTTVSDHLKARGVKMRMTPMGEAEIDRAVDLYASGLSLEQVGRALGVDGETVRQRLLERGIVMRARRGRK